MLDTTTIQVQRSTLELLRKTKERAKADSYDETIRFLYKKGSKASTAGALARKKSYSKAEILKGLRDRNDRF